MVTSPADAIETLPSDSSPSPRRSWSGRVSRWFESACRNTLVLAARFLSGASVRWYDCQPDVCQRIYFANHTSHLDALVIWASLPHPIRKRTRMVAAQDYWDAGPIRRYISRRLFNAILIERENVKIHNTPVNVMIREMGDHYAIIMFPEGGRGEGETVGEFKSGLYHMGRRRPDIELIPIYIDNMNRILPRGRTLPVPMLSRIIFGPPIWLEKDETKEAFLARAREAVIQLKDRFCNDLD
ncbi:MAG: lysophospholipid acyltransferase family protein [Thermoguttaceae bacterium]